MAFNFNWSPLTADSDFYSRAKELLTTALNKSPKPPIIVDDILVNELNLGSVPPNLEILEVGDLAEDRFRGIFKMCYSGDAFLTLKTRVQANPLNTYLSTKPSFASPQPLAAASGLTIPLKITLSDIKLSAFIILVFSKQKGITVVFRNDPLESLKVSSTFDSIPFVRNYLQKEIEAQLRVLLMEELPVIIHRLSLRLFVPEYTAMEAQDIASRSSVSQDNGVKPIDPLATPPQNPLDAMGTGLDTMGIPLFSLDSNPDVPSQFSQKNLLRLAALTDSQRTLSLFTPSIRDTVFRAWASVTEKGEGSFSPSATTTFTPSLSRANSLGTTSSVRSFTEGSDDGSPQSARHSINGIRSMSNTGSGSSRHSRGHTQRKTKKRVVNLRRSKDSSMSDTESVSGESTTSYTASTSSGPRIPPSVPEERDDELVTPPRSPNSRVRFRHSQENVDATPRPPVLNLANPVPRQAVPSTPTLAVLPDLANQISGPASAHKEFGGDLKMPPSIQMNSPAEASLHIYSLDKRPIPTTSVSSTTSGRALEHAWSMKMAGEIIRRVQDEKLSHLAFWDPARSEQEENPPPAYEASAKEVQ